MKKIWLGIAFLLPAAGWAQVANDNCTTAQAIVIPGSGNICITGTTVGAVSDNTTNACDTGVPGNEVWFVYTATGTQNTITVTPTGGPALQQAVLTVDGTGCADATFNACNASPTNGGTASVTWTFTPGTQVWISVESNNGVQGSFQLCITSITPPAGAGSSCATATTICNTNTFTVATFPNNNNAFTPPCFFSSLQQPIFYQFTVGQSGTCMWQADPNGAAEYDWAMYNITAGCPGTLVCCNYNYASATGAPIGMATGGAGACGTSGFAGAPGELSPPANVTAGQTYLIIIDNYSNNNVGFTMTWGGTFQIAPVANFTATPTTACNSANVTINNTSVASTSYSWNFGNGNTSTATNPPAQTYSSPGTYMISLVATSATGCQDVHSVPITINAGPTVNVPPNATYCPGAAVPASAFTSNPGGATYTWTNSNTGIGLGASGSGNVPAFTATNGTGAAITGTITVTPTLGGCVGTPSSYTITVNPNPSATVPANASYCPGASVPASNFTSTPAGATFNWTNSNTAIGLGASGSGNQPAFTATNGGSTAITGTITVTPTLNGCTGTPSTYTITVNPNPTANVPANASYCPGAAVPASNFTSTPAGATFNWTNSNTAIGLGASGSGNQPAFTATNGGSTAVSGTITVTPTLAGCTGTASTYTITVNPNPTATVPANATYCPGAAVPASNFTSTPAGATFNWTNSNTGIGLGASGAGNQPAFTATNGGGAAISGTITVTPTLAGCTGTPSTYTITINPNPTTTVPANATYCPGAAVPASNFTSTPAGGTFNWTNSNTAIGLGASGSGNQPAFTATNGGSTAISGTVSVTSTLNGCTGPAATYTITVNPNPTANVPANGTYCPGVAVPASNFTSTPAGATYAWTNSNTAIGLGASGSGNQPAFTATNGGSTAISGTITVTPTLAGCTGAPATYTITINPNPTATVPANASYCPGAAVPASNFTSTPAGATYTWTNSNTGIGLGASGSGNQPAFTATNGTGSPISGTITVTPTLAGCTGSPVTYTITVNDLFDATITPAGPFCANGPSVTLTAADPGGTWSGTGITNAAAGTFDPSVAGAGTWTITYTIPGSCGSTDTENFVVNAVPTANLPANITVCNGGNVPASNYTSNPAGGTFAWTNSDPSIGLAASGSGNTPAFTATNGGSTAVTSNISVTPTVNGCVGTPSSYTITVNPTPTVTVPANITACNGDNIPAFNFTSTPAGGTFAWTNSDPSIGLAASGSGNTPAFTATNGGSTAVTANINVTPTVNGCPGTPSAYSITVNPTPTVTVPANITLCNGGNVPASNFTSTPAGGTFAWTNSDPSIGLAASGSGNTPAFTATNGGSAAVTSTVNVTPTANGCPGTPSSYTITVNPTPTVTVPANITACQGQPVAANNFTSTPAGGTFAWTNSNTAIGLGASGSGNQPAFTATNGTGSNITGTITVTPTVNGCVGTPSSYDITVTDQMDATITPAGPFCESAASVILSAATTGGTWSGTGITNASTGNFDPAVATPGTWTITYMLTSFCGDTATTTIDVLPDMDATITPAGPFCDNDPAVTLTAADPGGTWNGTGITNASTGSFDPSVAGTGTWTISYSIPGQCGDTQTTSITINNDLDATINPAGPFCASNPNTFLAAATPGGVWSGPGIINTATGEFSPTNAGAGNHTITYMLNGSCGDTATVSIQVFADADATITPAGPFCITDPALNLTAAQSGGVWSGNGITNAATGTFNPSTAGAGTHTITYSISGVCGDTDTENIVVVDLIASNITPAGPFCVNASPVILTAANPGGTWSGPGITNPATGAFNPATAGAGTHTITYTIAGSCGTSSTTNITVNPLPVVTFNGDVLSGCSPVVTQFTNTTGGSSSCSWSVDGVPVSANCASFTNTFTAPGCYDITLTTTSAAGCTASATQADMVCVFAYPVAEFTFSPVDATVLNPTINFMNTSQGAATYSWDFAGLGTSNAVNPSFTFPNTGAGSYEVCLEAVSANGCIDSVCQFVPIFDEFIVYVPNAFTVDDDGLNDVFMPVISGHDPLSYEFMVFNRWGELIFESHFAQVGWDGSYKGVPAKQDVYVWKLRAKKGNNLEQVDMYGHVTLLRGK